MKKQSKPGYLNWLRKQPCAVCKGEQGVVGHHPTGSNLRGVGMKAPDKLAYPLCHRHHTLRHNGDWKAEWRAYDLDPEEEQFIGKQSYEKWVAESKLLIT